MTCCFKQPPVPVSIPAGFSDALRPKMAVASTPTLHQVSIPAGFSDALRPQALGHQADSTLVSIPAGFSDALRHDGVSSFRCNSSSFNPCWVF